jgi:hypothetical protein
MKRTPFARPQPARATRDRSEEFASYTAPSTACRMASTVATMSVPVPKDRPARSEQYRRLVAAMPCAHCGRPGPSQAAHADSAGKGLGIKPSDYEIMPLCADSPGRHGCHWLIGASGIFTKEQRRALEAKYVDNTKGLLLGVSDAKS